MKKPKKEKKIDHLDIQVIYEKRAPACLLDTLQYTWNMARGCVYELNGCTYTHGVHKLLEKWKKGKDWKSILL